MPRLRSWTTTITTSRPARGRASSSRVPSVEPSSTMTSCRARPGARPSSASSIAALDRGELVVHGHQDRERCRARAAPISRDRAVPAPSLSPARGYASATAADAARRRRARADDRRHDGSPTTRGCFVIAEIGHNHQGSVEKAKELFVRARRTAASTRSSCRSATTARCTRARCTTRPTTTRTASAPTYGEHREALELDRGAYVELRECARELGLVFFATAFDEPSADLLAELDLPAFKIASGDLRNTPLLRHVASFGKPMSSRRAAATIEDVDRAVETVLPLNPQLCLCSAPPPTRPRSRSSSCGVIETLRERYPELVIGLSDHQDGIAMSLVAYMLGARVIEKHFTLSHAWKGTDHAFSLMPEGMRKLVRDLAARPGRDRRRGQAAAAERGEAAGEDGQEARRRPGAAGGPRARARATSWPSRPRTVGLPPYELDRSSVGRSLRRSPLEQEVTLERRRAGRGARSPPRTPRA